MRSFPVGVCAILFFAALVSTAAAFSMDDAAVVRMDFNGPTDEDLACGASVGFEGNQLVAGCTGLDSTGGLARTGGFVKIDGAGNYAGRADAYAYMRVDVSETRQTTHQASSASASIVVRATGGSASIWEGDKEVAVGRAALASIPYRDFLVFTGVAISPSGSKVVLAAHNAAAEGRPSESGVVFLYERLDAGAWSEPKMILADAGLDVFWCGSGVAFGDDDHLIVGCQNNSPGDGVGRVFVHKLAGTDVTATSEIPNPGSVASFGWSVAVSADGSTLAVGAPYSGDGIVHVFAATAPGSYALSATISPSTSTLYNCGWSLAISSDGSVVVSACGNTVGGVMVIRRNAGSFALDTDSEVGSVASGSKCYEVALSPAADKVAVGCYEASYSAGAVVMLTTADLAPQWTWNAGTSLEAPSTARPIVAAGADDGLVVAGSTVLPGAVNQARAQMFRISGAAFAGNGESEASANSLYYFISACMTADGNDVVFGDSSQYEAARYSRSGAAFTRVGALPGVTFSIAGPAMASLVAPDGSVLVTNPGSGSSDPGEVFLFDATLTSSATIAPPAAAAGGTYGAALAMSGDGTVLAVGADSGGVAVFAWNGTAYEFDEAVVVRGGRAIALNDDGTVLAAAPGTSDVHFFARDGGAFALFQTYTGPAGVAFGSSIAMRPNSLEVFVGAPRTRFGLMRDAGTVHVLQRASAAANFSAAGTLEPQAPTSRGLYGTSVQLLAGGTKLVVSAGSSWASHGVDGPCAFLFGFPVDPTPPAPPPAPPGPGEDPDAASPAAAMPHLMGWC